MDFGKPVVAVGANKPMRREMPHGETDSSDDWEGLNGADGLNGVHPRVSTIPSPC